MKIQCTIARGGVLWICCSAAVAQTVPTDDGLRQAFERSVYSLKDSGQGIWRGENRAQRVTVEFDAGGARLRHPDGNIEFHLRGYGYGERLVKPAPANLVGKANRLEYQRGDITEWYVNGTQGLEQGFTFKRRPAGPRNGGPLTITLGVTGELVPEERGSAVVLVSGKRVVLRYAGLTAKDARGDTIPSKLEVRDGEIRLVVEDRKANYPLTIDPTWSQQQELTASDGGTYDDFGYSVAVSGGTAVISATQKTVGSNSDQGSVYVFVLSGTTWTQQAELTASDGVANDHFGTAVSISGDTVLIGATVRNTLTGVAYVFVRSGTTWSQQAELTASDAATLNDFGAAVSVSGDTAVIGAPERNSSTGAAYVFVRSGTVWSQQAELTASDAATGGGFGAAVAVSGTTVAIGASGHTVNAHTDQGAAYVFVQIGGVSWTQQAELLASDGALNYRFGSAVSVNGGTALIGATGNKINGHNNQGAAYVFVQSGSTWSQQAELTASDGAAANSFGSAVSVDGSTAVIGARGHAVGSNSSQGAGYVFLQSGSTWSQQSEVTASDGAAGDFLGITLSVSGGTAVFGSYTHAVNGQSNQGDAYIFTVPASLSISATHLSPIFQAGPGAVTLTVANTGGPTIDGATISDTIDAGFTINSADPGCSISGQTVTCTIASGAFAASTAFNVYVTASPTASASLSNTATLTDNTDTVASGTSTDTIAVSTQAAQVDSSLTQIALSGSTDNGLCANNNLTLTATDLLQNTSAGTLTNPYAVIDSLSGGNTLLSQSASVASVPANGNVTFTFHIQLATCNTFQLSFDVLSN